MKVYFATRTQKRERGGMREEWPYYYVFSGIGGMGRGERVGFVTVIGTKMYECMMMEILTRIALFFQDGNLFLLLANYLYQVYGFIMWIQRGG